MSRNRRLLVAALTATALFSVIVLAAGLSDVPPEERQESLALHRRATPAGAPAAGGAETGGETHPETLSERGRAPLVALIIALAALVIFMLVTGEGRKLLAYTLLGALLLLLLLLLRRPPAAEAPNPTPTAEQVAGEAPTPTPLLTVTVTPPPPASEALGFEPQPWLVLGASLGLALLVVGALALAGLHLVRGRQQALSQPRTSPRAELAEEARRALEELGAGQDLHGTIIRCYREMGEILLRHRGIRRGPAMTAEEFARGLSATTLPQEDIWQITRLFEHVRYSQYVPAPTDESEAVACLKAIVRACEEPS